jgi:cytochrome c-type biogenesis protein CcmH
MKRILLIALLATAAFAQSKAPDAEQLVGGPKGTALTGATLEVEAQRVSGLLRCPVCQGLSVADSPAEMAVNMKHQVRELLARGYTEDQILHYFELSYGQFVLLKPKFQGVNVLVWILPVGALLLGLAIVMTKMKKLQAEPNSGAAVSSPAPEDPYIAQVRDLVGGGKR